MIRRIALLMLPPLLACGRAGKPRVVVYVSLDEMYSRPLLEAFEKKEGIDVEPVFDTEVTKTVGLVNKLLAMKDRPEADVFWNNELMNSILLKRRGLLEKYVPPTARDIPAAFKDPDGAWVGFGARARVILYNKDLVEKYGMNAPDSIYDFTKPPWKGRFTIARPIAGTTLTHVAALYAVLGREKAEELLKAWKENNVQLSDGNAMARNMVRDGQIAACLTDTDDANGALLSGAPVEMVYPDQDGIGTLVIPNSVVLIRGGPNPEAARKLVDYIASREVEARLAKIKSAQMPLRPGIEPYNDRFDLNRIKAMAVDWEKVADMLEPAKRFVEETFLR